MQPWDEFWGTLAQILIGTVTILMLVGGFMLAAFWVGRKFGDD